MIQKTIKQSADELLEKHLGCFIVPSSVTAIRAAIVTVKEQIEMLELISMDKDVGNYVFIEEAFVYGEILKDLEGRLC